MMMREDQLIFTVNYLKTIKDAEKFIKEPDNKEDKNLI